MKPDLNLASKIKNLKLGEHFMVGSEQERQAVCRTAKVLKEAGAIAFDIVTKKDGKKFKVAAI